MTKKILAALVLMVGTSATALAQPKDPYAEDPNQPLPAPKQAPVDPYATPKPKQPPATPKQPPAKQPTPKKDDGPLDPYATPHAPAPATPPATPKAPPAPAPTPTPVAATNGVVPRVSISDVPTVQGLLAVQHLDGWLLMDRDGENPIARRLVAPDGHPQRAWFYMIPKKGDPVALVHASEVSLFDHLAGQKLTYDGYRDLDKQMKALLGGAKAIAVEYAPKASVPAMSKIDGTAMDSLKAANVQVRSSDTLVQYTKAIWGEAGHTAHYVAAHHIIELRKEALAFITKRVQSGATVSEYEVQQQIVHGMSVRGISGPPPGVAAGVNSADPFYVPTAAKTATIAKGDLVVITIAGKVDKPDGVFAAQTWCAVVDSSVPERMAKVFETAALARDRALALVTERAQRNKPLTGAEVDDETRALIKKAGLAGNVKHRTGHSIDNDFQGGGADLDDFEVKDSRTMTPGTGFTVGPGLYFAGQFGIRTEVSVYLGPTGAEVTTPAQEQIEALLK